MALIVSSERTLKHPTEGGEFVLRLPLRAGDFLDPNVNAATTAGEMTLRLIEKTLLRWPYDAPVTWENICSLDPPTTRWLSGEISAASNLTDDAGNASGASSSATTGQVLAPSPTSSGT